MSRRLTGSQEELLQALAQGANRRDTDGASIAELGWSVGLWNGIDDERAVTLDVRCGCYSDVAPNVCIVRYEQYLDKVFPTVQSARAVVEAAVRAWDPQAVSVTSDPLLDALENALAGPVTLEGCLPGWIAYFAKNHAIRTDWPGVVSVESYRDSGTLVVISEQPPSAEKVEDVARLAGFVQHARQGTYH